MIDTHCHLSDPRLLASLDEVLARAERAGVRGMVTIGTGPRDWGPAAEIARRRPRARCALGIHPNHCAECGPDDIDRLRDAALAHPLVALGEMGLDYHYAFADRATQRRFFERQVELACALGLRVVIHCREAVDDTLDVLRGFPAARAVFHCFTGSPAEAERVVAAGHLLGITGVVTFRNADALREAVRRTPRDRLVVETDAPYLAPEPVRRQKVNEPALVMHTAAEVARVWGVGIDEVDAITTANAEAFFGVDWTAGVAATP